jgi:acetyl esterase/lipase
MTERTKNMSGAGVVLAGFAAWTATAFAQAPMPPPVPASISPEAQAFYRNMRPRPPVEMDYTDAQAMQRMRNGLAQMFLANARRIATDYRLEEVDAGGVTAYWVRTGTPRHAGKAIIYLHGGGYILGSAVSNLGIPLRIGPAAGIPVLSVEYRLAPEQPYPAALDDCLAAYRWLLKSGRKGSDIAFMGDSAGGGLAVACALGARRDKLPLPAAVVALSPLTDLSPTSDTRVTLAAYDPIVVGDPTVRFGAYAGTHDRRDPLISPVYGDFAGFPPLLIQVGTREVLLSDSVRLARRARAAGVDVTLDVWEGMWHVWQDHATAPEARMASEEIARFLEARLTAG